MGGSRRRLKRNAPKVRVGTGVSKRKKNEKSRVPLEVLERKPDIPKKLNTEVLWETKANVNENYQLNKLVADPNEGFGRNNAVLPLKSKEEREENGEMCFDDDDELRAGCNLERHSGPPPPPRLTPKQRSVVTSLVAAHGENVHAMVLDTRRNRMQLSEGQLRKMIEAAQYWDGTSNERHDFRAPIKRPKKLF